MESDMSDLEAILSGEEGAEAEQPQSEGTTAEVEATDAPAENVEPEATAEAVEPTGVEPAEEAADVSPASEDTKVAAIQAGLEAELARIRAKNRELEERVNQQPAEEKPDFFEDPDGALQTMEQRMEQKIARARVDWSEQAARRRYDDFDDKIGAFTELANENPALWQQMGQSVDPAEFAYTHADQAMKMREFGDIKSFEEKVRADERAKAEAKVKAEYEAKMKELSGLPESLSDTRAAGGNSSPPVTNESLEDVLGR
jgi:hypothetical protein